MKSYEQWRDENMNDAYNKQANTKAWGNLFVIPRDAEAIKASFKARQKHHARKFWKNTQ